MLVMLEFISAALKVMHVTPGGGGASSKHCPEFEMYATAARATAA